MSITSIRLDEIEDEILARIESQIPNAAVESYPDDPERYSLSHPAGAILLRFDGETTPKRDSEEFIIQDRTVTFVVSVISNSLRSVKDSNVYHYIESVRDALTGWSVTDFEDCYLTDFQFANFDSEKKRWQYDGTLELTQVITEEV